MPGISQRPTEPPFLLYVFIIKNTAILKEVMKMSSYLPDHDRPPDGYENCPVFLIRYLDYLNNNRGRRPQTITEAMLVLREYCQYVHYRRTFHEPPSTWDAHKDMGISEMTVCELAQVRRDDLEEYLCFLDNVAHNAMATIRKKLSMLRRFYSYLMRFHDELGIQFPEGDPAAGLLLPPVGRSQPATLTPAQLQKLVDAVTGANYLRDKGILLIFITTGITLAEAVALNRSDFRPQEVWLRIRGGTKDDTRYVYLTETCQDAIEQYLAQLRQTEDLETDGEKPLLCSSSDSHKRLSPKSVRNVITKVSQNAGFGEDVTPRVLRDSVNAILTNHAGRAFRSQVFDYLGYRYDARLRNRFDVAKDLQTENHTMARIVQTSPLGRIGTGKGA